MADKLQGFVPARYVGSHAIQLRAVQAPFYNIDGTRRTSLTLGYGDEIMMPESSIKGYTILYDPHSVHDPKLLGSGRRVLPEHAQLDDRELSRLGYEFHVGRPDFEAIEEPSSPPAQSEQAPSVETSPPPEQPSPTVSPISSIGG